MFGGTTILGRENAVSTPFWMRRSRLMGSYKQTIVAAIIWSITSKWWRSWWHSDENMQFRHLNTSLGSVNTNLLADPLSVGEKNLIKKVYPGQGERTKMVRWAIWFLFRPMTIVEKRRVFSTYISQIENNYILRPVYTAIRNTGYPQKAWKSRDF